MSACLGIEALRALGPRLEGLGFMVDGLVSRNLVCGDLIHETLLLKDLDIRILAISLIKGVVFKKFFGGLQYSLVAVAMQLQHTLPRTTILIAAWGQNSHGIRHPNLQPSCQ